MLEIIRILVDLCFMISVFYLIIGYYKLKKSLKQTDRIINHNTDSTIKFYSKQQRINSELKHCLECLCDTVEELEKSKPTKSRGKDEPKKIFKGTKNEQIIKE